MALFRITVKSSRVSNGVRIEKGMSVEIPSKYTNPVTANGGHEVQDAFMRIYGVDLKKAVSLSTVYLDVEKIN